MADDLPLEDARSGAQDCVAVTYGNTRGDFPYAVCMAVEFLPSHSSKSMHNDAV